MGNTCYMNSVIQSLISLKPLEKYISSEKCKTDESRNLSRVLELSKNKDTHSIVLPSSLYKSLCNFSNFFKSRAQQDSHECYLIFIDILEIGMGRKLNLVYGEYNTVLICKNCGVASKTKDECVSLLYTRNTFKKEIIKDYKCDKCSVTGSVEKSYDASKVPEILCIQVNRFGDGYVKNNSSFNINDKIYGMYELQSIIMHSGNYLSGGHYYSISKRDGVWICFNDSVFSPINLSDIKKNEVYMLFYTKN